MPVRRKCRWGARWSPRRANHAVSSAQHSDHYFGGVKPPYPSKRLARVMPIAERELESAGPE